MSDTYNIACRDCKKSLWIGQSQNSNPPFCFYSGEPETMQNLRMFLWEHRRHSLVMDEVQSLEIDGVIPESESA